MRPGLLFLPFLGLLFAAFGAAISSSFPDQTWIAAAGYGLGGAMVVLWVALDFEHFKLFFGRKGTKYGASSGVMLIMGILVIGAIGFVSNKPRFNKSVDLTREGMNTLSLQSVKIIEGLKTKNIEPDITAFFQDPQVETKFKDLIQLYQAEGANLKIQYIDPQSDPTKAMAEKITSGNTVIFRLGDRETRITNFTEEKITNAIMNTMKDKSKTVYFTKGHGEGQFKGSEPSGFDLIVQEMANNKYDVKELTLLEETKVPDDADLLVIGGPKYDFNAEELRFVEEYLNKGGALFVMIDSMVPAENLNKLLNKFGINLENDLIIMHPNDPRADILGRNNAIVSEFDDFNPVTKDFSRQSSVAMLMPMSRTMGEVAENQYKMKVNMAAKTAKVMVKVKGVKSESDLRNLTQDRLEAGSFPVLAIATGKTQSPATADASKAPNGESSDKSKPDVAKSNSDATDKNKEIRIIVAGSSTFARNEGVQAAQHRDLFLNSANYLLQDEDFISIRPKDETKSTIDLTTGSSQLTMFFISFIYPFLFLGGGIYYWLRRRRS